MPRRHTPVFLPSINEDGEKTDERIEDIKKALKIEKTDRRKNGQPFRVRSAQNNDGRDELDAPAQTKRAPVKPLLRRSSSSDAWNRKSVQLSSLVNGKQRARTGCLNTRQKLYGFGQRKLISPRIDDDRKKLALNDAPDTIDLTTYEDVQAILQRFYVEDLKMDSSDPRLSCSEDYKNSLRAKAERRFSFGEMWHSINDKRALVNGRKNKTLTKQLPASVDGAERGIAQLRKHQAEDSPSKILSRKLENLKHKPNFEVTYARPQILKSTMKATVPGTRNVLTSSFQKQPNDCKKYCEQSTTMPKRSRATFLRPINRQKCKPLGFALLNNNSEK